MILDHHIYRLHDDHKRLLASANTLADARTIAAYLFTRDPQIQGVDISAWSYDRKRQAGGFSHAVSILRPQVAMAKAA